MNNKFQKKEIQNNEDVIIDILLRLPSKSLARSRCVSKYWNTLITCPSFIKAHLQRPSKLGHHHLIYQGDIETKRTNFSRLKMLWRFSAAEGCNSEELFSKIDYHLIIAGGFKKFKLVESINGIVCLYEVNQKASSTSSRILLLNPTINDCFVVPEPQFPILSAKCYCVGFGFNPLTSHYDDFKVVSITLYYEEEGDDDNDNCSSSSRAEIYSRRTNSWKELRVGWIPKWSSSDITSNQVIYEEYICWSPYYTTKKKKTIVSFNVVSEQFHEMTLPDSIPSHDSVNGCITLLDGCVSLIVPSAGCYEVWTMKEFDNIESWIKLYYIDLPPVVLGHRGGPAQKCIRYRPLGFASTDEALFCRLVSSGRNEVLFCDTTSMANTTIWIRTGDRIKTRISLDYSLVDCRFKLYVESLIPISYLAS